MQRLSDFIFLVHQEMCKEDPNPQECLNRIEWVIHNHIANTETDSVIKTLTTIPGFPSADDLDWPGMGFTTGDISSNMVDQAAEALIGCPNGSGVAFLLSRHRPPNEYGWKTIDEAYYFKDDIGWDSLAYHILPLSGTAHGG